MFGYDYVEVMACHLGCPNGGGQIGVTLSSSHSFGIIEGEASALELWMLLNICGTYNNEHPMAGGGRITYVSVLILQTLF